MTLTLRAPSGLPTWPKILLAGMPKTGKSWAAAEFTGHPLIGQAFWIQVGETTADEYGAVPGADYVIAEHDGTYRGILTAVRAVAAEPRAADSRPNLLVLDSGTRLWDLLSDEAQAVANDRLDARNAKYRKARREPEDDASIGTDIWNRAKDRWYQVLDALLLHDGPVIITARMEEQAVMVDGQPTKDRTWKINAHKRLPFDVSVVVEYRDYRIATVTGVQSVRWTEKETGSLVIPRFTVADLHRKLGIITGEEGMVQPSVRALDPAAGAREQRAADAAEAAKAAAAESFENARPRPPEEPNPADGMTWNATTHTYENPPTPPAAYTPPVTPTEPPQPPAPPAAADVPAGRFVGGDGDWVSDWSDRLHAAYIAGNRAAIQQLGEEAKRAGRADLLTDAQNTWRRLNQPVAG